MEEEVIQEDKIQLVTWSLWKKKITTDEKKKCFFSLLASSFYVGIALYIDTREKAKGRGRKENLQEAHTLCSTIISRAVGFC